MKLGSTTYTQEEKKKNYRSPKPQSPLDILQLARPPAVGIYPSVTGKMLRASHKVSRDALRSFLALCLILSDPMDIKASDSQSSGFVCACFISKLWSLILIIKKKNPPENKQKGWETVRYPASAFALRYTGPACKPAKFRPHRFTSAHLPGIAYISRTPNPANFFQIASMQIPFKHIHPLCAANDNVRV